MLSILEILRRTTDYFRRAEVPSPRLDAELLIGHALGMRREQLYINFERPLEEEELEVIRGLVRRRAAREPLQYIIGEVEFDGLRLKVDPRVLIPRPETEELVELLADRFSFRRVLDLGTGSGAIALALLKHAPEATGVATDHSQEALAVARGNAQENQLTERIQFVESNWFAGLDAGEPFDLIVSNPPYLNEEEWASAQPEVREFEPKTALVSGPEGTDALAEILSGAPRHLTETGVLALETGIAQHKRLAELARQAGFSRSESIQDLSRRPRFFLACAG